MISNQLVLSSLVHPLQRVEGALKISSKGVASASLDHLLHDVVSLLLGDARPQGVALQVTTNSNAGGYDHVSLVLREWWACQLTGIHVRHVSIFRLVAMIVLNDLIHKRSKGLVGVM